MSQVSTTEQGRVVERIVAEFHDRPGVTVRRNVRLDPTDPHSAEMDVLVEGKFQGWPLKLGFDCKNHMKPIGVTFVRDFRDRLDEFGIPLQHGFIVSASPFTKPALDRAKALEIRTLLLQGLTLDQLAVQIHHALQSVVLVLPALRLISFGVTEPDTDQRETFFYIKEAGDRFEGFTITDHILREWVVGSYGTDLGERTGRLGPQGYLQVRRGELGAAAGALWRIEVIAFVGFVPGTAEHLRLADARTRITDTQRILLDFPSPDGLIPLKVCKSEVDLKEALSTSSARYRLHPGRIIVPRLIMNLGSLWPPSQDYSEALEGRMQALQAMGLPADPAKLDVRDLLGDDLLAVLAAPFWSGYPDRMLPALPDELSGRIDILRFNH